jgi:hypothetical protein
MSVSMCTTPVAARQRLYKNVTAATITHTTIQEHLEASPSMRSESYQMKVGYLFFQELLVILN